MKAIAICILFLSILVKPNFVKYNSVEKTNDNKRFDIFVDFVMGHYRVPIDLQEDCNWHYAVVKAYTRNNVIVKYAFVNDVSESFNESFKYLLGYKFPGPLLPKNAPIVFCMTIYNQRLETCKVPRTVTYSPSEVLMKVMSTLDSQKRKEPNSIVLLTPVFSLVYEPQQ